VATWLWTEEYSPAERSAAWVIEEWLCQGPTLRWLASRWTSRADLFAAYLRRLPTVDPARAEFTAYPPVNSEDRRGEYATPPHANAHPATPTIHSGLHGIHPGGGVERARAGGHQLAGGRAT